MNEIIFFKLQIYYLFVLKQLIVQPENNAVTIKNKLNQIQELKNFNRAEQVLIDKRKKELGYSFWQDKEKVDDFMEL